MKISKLKKRKLNLHSINTIYTGFMPKYPDVKLLELYSRYAVKTIPDIRSRCLFATFQHNHDFFRKIYHYHENH